jgi:hypothetical protein
MAKAKKQPKEYIVTMRVTYEGAYTSVMAETEEEARQKVENFEFENEINVSGAELVDYKIRKVEKD